MTRYIVGVDGSEPSRRAIDWTERRAREAHVPVVLVHVRELSSDAREPEDGSPRDDRNGRGLIAAESDRLTRLGADVSGIVLDGPLPWALAGVARADDIVVVGTHKTGYLRGRVLGSRGVQVAMAVPASVVIVPDIDLRFRRGVVVGIDRVETAVPIARLAAEEAARRGEDLSLLESVDPAGSPHEELPIAQAARVVGREHPGLVIRSRVSTRPPAEALLDAARDKALLVLGPGSLEPERAPIGSVLHEVLLNITSPVLVARPPEFRRVVPRPETSHEVVVAAPAPGSVSHPGGDRD